MNTEMRLRKSHQLRGGYVDRLRRDCIPVGARMEKGYKAAVDLRQEQRKTPTNCLPTGGNMNGDRLQPSCRTGAGRRYAISGATSGGLQDR